jgi:hypothetical protein
MGTNKKKGGKAHTADHGPWFSPLSAGTQIRSTAEKQPAVLSRIRRKTLLYRHKNGKIAEVIKKRRDTRESVAGCVVGIEKHAVRSMWKIPTHQEHGASTYRVTRDEPQEKSTERGD